MKLEHHEEVFRDRLQHHHEPVNTTELWNEIQPYIGPTAKKWRFLPFWWLFGLFLLLGITAFTFWQSLDEEGEVTSESPVFVAQNESNNVEEEPLVSVSESTSTHEQQVTSTVLESRLALKENERPASTTHKNDEISTAVAFSGRRHTNTVTNEDYNAPVLTEKHSNHLQSVAPVIESTLLSSRVYEESMANEFAGVINYQTPTKEISAASELPFNTTAVTMLNDGMQQAPILEPAPRKKRFELVAEAGWGRFSSDLSPVDEEPDYALASDPTPGHATKEDALFRAHVGVQYALSPSFYIQTGIGYLQLKNQANLNNVVEYQTNENGLLNTYFTDDLANVNLGTNVEFVNTVRQDVNHRATRRYVEIPLKVGYKKSLRRFAIGGFVGAAVNLPTHKSGNYLGAANRLIPVAEAKNQSVDEPSNIGISYMAGIEAGYHLTPGLEIYVSPFGSYMTNMQGLSEATENLTALGFNVGMRLRI